MRKGALLGLGLTCAGATLPACDSSQNKAPSAPRERSQAIQSTAATTTLANARATSAVAGSASAPPKRRRALCAGGLQEGKSLPKKPVSRAAEDAAGELPADLKATEGSWLWVNFWAAWCAPCKEEIPRLFAWERQLSSRQPPLRVAYVSLDDDERQLRQFLQASSHLKATYWLREGKERDEWMSAAALEPDPELPIHLLVDPKGRVRCKVQGAVEDTDFSELERLLGG